MQFIQHRVNRAAQLANIPSEFGVELDLRDRGKRLILEHDPFGDGEDFTSYLNHYRHGLMILNIKSERIEPRVLEAIQDADIDNYFFLDCSFPMIRWLIRQGQRKIAVRFSEFEPVESAMAMAGQIDWVWVDCFTRMPLDGRSYQLLSTHFKLCAVSPELQGRPVESIAAYAEQLQPYPVDAVCTKRPDLWQQALQRLPDNSSVPT